MPGRMLLLLLFFSLYHQVQGDDKIPVVVISDLYFPGQDVGDNFDILTPYALPEIDLKGVIFDVSEQYRKDSNAHAAAREPGYISMIQLNYIFNRNVPCACSPFVKMRNINDKMNDLPPFQQQGLDLFFKILKDSKQKVQVVSTGSCRLLAVAYNRNPRLMKRKIEAIHVSAGASSDVFREWNIELDTLAACRLLSSNLPVNIYPCATKDGPFDKGTNNTFWSMDDLSFVLDMEPMLRNYLVFAFLHKNRTDYLNYLESPLSESDRQQFLQYQIDLWYGSGGKHYVWETALWQQVAHRKLVKRTSGENFLLPEKEMVDGDESFDEGLYPVTIDVEPSGLFGFKRTGKRSNFAIYHRNNPEINQQWLRKALPVLYKSFKTNN